GEMAEAIRGGQANQETLRQQGANLIEYELDNLADAAARLGALEGQKHVLFFTEGFDSSRMTDIKVRAGPPQVNDRLLGFMKRLHDTFASAGVMLDTIDIKGLRHTFTDLDNEALYELSRGTGGRVVVNRNDFVEAIDTLTTAQSVVYVLGFHPGDRAAARREDAVRRRADLRLRLAGRDGDGEVGTCEVRCAPPGEQGADRYSREARRPAGPLRRESGSAHRWYAVSRIRQT